VIEWGKHTALEFHGRIVFLNASTWSPRAILLNSTTPEFSSGLANSSGQLGHNLMDHTMAAERAAAFPATKIKSHSAAARMVFTYPLPQCKKQASQFSTWIWLSRRRLAPSWERGSELAGFGAEFKHQLSRPGPWMFDFYGLVNVYRDPENFAELDKEVKDEWGIPSLRIHCAWSDNERALLKDMSITAAEMLSAAGAKRNLALRRR